MKTVVRGQVGKSTTLARLLAKTVNGLFKPTVPWFAIRVRLQEVQGVLSCFLKSVDFEQ